VITANDGQEALMMVEEYRPDLIVTDIVMPQMNGYELVRRVRQQPPFRLLPVILLTARTKTQERILGYQSGCDLYLPKPFELEELAAAIRNLLERSQIIQSEYRFSHLRSQIIQSEYRFSHQGNVNNSPQPKAVEAHHPQYNHIQQSQIISSLTTREQEVLDLLTHGFSNAEMGLQLHLSARTVEKYVSSLLRKTDTSNRAELVRFAIKHGLVE
jgi:DNA-binding NarL/FixJ family response regulator